MGKAFSSFNGYEVKDAVARKLAQELKENAGSYSASFMRDCYVKNEITPAGTVEKLVVKAGTVPAKSGTSAETGVTLDTVAYGGMTYGQIFEENNLLGFQSFEEPLPPDRWEPVGTGQIGRTNEAALNGIYSLKVVSSGALGGDLSGMTHMKSDEMRVYLGETYFSGCMVRVDAYNAAGGVCGYQLAGVRKGYNAVTDGFQPTVHTYTVEEKDVLPAGYFVTNNRLGYVSAPSLTGNHAATFYLDVPVLVRTSALWENIPSHEMMRALYRNYVALKSGGTLSPVEYAEEIYVLSEPETAPEDGLSRFVAKMNERATQLGMESTEYFNPSGIAPEVANVSTARDLMKLGIAACEHNELLKAWNAGSARIKFGGSNPREIDQPNIISFYQLGEGAWQGERFKFIGGKAGLWSDDDESAWNKSIVLLSKTSDGKSIITAVTGPQEYSQYNAAIECTYYANQKLKGVNVSNQNMTTAGCVSAIACLVPQFPAAAEGTTPEILYEYNADIPGNCASTSKIMTAILALEDTADVLTEVVTVKDADDVGYSGAIAYVGEKLTMRDAVAGMMKVSSNMLAHAIGRTIGEKMLKAERELINKK